MSMNLEGGFFSPLNPEEEIVLAKQIEARHLMQVLGIPDPVIESQGVAARERFIGANMELVRRIARGFSGTIMDRDDFIQEGTIFLLRAVDGFNYREDVSLSSYAKIAIKRGIEKARLGQDRAVALPDYLGERAGKLRRLSAKLAQAVFREPTEGELAAGLGLEIEEIRNTRIDTQPVASLDARIGEDGARLGDMIPDKVDGDRHSLEGSIGRLLIYLPKNMRRAIEGRIIDGLGQDVVASELGIAEKDFIQLLKKGLDALRRIVENPGLLVPERLLLDSLMNRTDIPEEAKRVVQMRLGLNGFLPQEWQEISSSIGKARSSAQRAFDKAMLQLGLSPQSLAYKE